MSPVAVVAFHSVYSPARSHCRLASLLLCHLAFQIIAEILLQFMYIVVYRRCIRLSHRQYQVSYCYENIVRNIKTASSQSLQNISYNTFVSNVFLIILEPCAKDLL